jgi:Mor family transcriptional regulator
LAGVLKEAADAVTNRNTKEEVEGLLEGLGSVIYRLMSAEGAEKNKEYDLLKRVFEEQYEVVGGIGEERDKGKECTKPA